MPEPLLRPFPQAASTAPPVSDRSIHAIHGSLLCAMRYGALGASSRLRLAQYAPYLRQAGLHVTLRPFLDDDYLAALYAGRQRAGAALAAYRRAVTLRGQIKSHSLLWIEKELLPWLPFWLERGMLRNVPYMLDFDDAWALRYAESNSPLVRLLLRNKFGKLLRGAELTIVANDTLYQWASSEGAKNILLLPTVIDLARYAPVPPPMGPFTVGWIGTPLTATYLTAIAEPLRALSQEQPFKLLVIGAPGFTLPGVDVESMAWTENTEAAFIGRCHAGIMPLPDTEWANGKSGYKLIQYMAMARPAIASPIGANSRIVLHGETGFLAHTAQDWVTHLHTLCANPTLTAEMGQAARRRVEQHYSLGVTAPILLDAITELLGNIAARKAGMHSAGPAR